MAGGTICHDRIQGLNTIQKEPACDRIHTMSDTGQRESVKMRSNNIGSRSAETLREESAPFLEATLGGILFTGQSHIANLRGISSPMEGPQEMHAIHGTRIGDGQVLIQAFVPRWTTRDNTPNTLLIPQLPIHPMGPLTNLRMSNATRLFHNRRIPTASRRRALRRHKIPPTVLV